MDKPLDRRKQRTRRALSDALIALILEKGFDAVTIQDITERADLRRATFYLHYKDKEELLMATLQATFDQLVSQLEPLMKRDTLAGKTQVETFRITFQHVADHHRLYCVILGGQGAAPIARHIREYIAGQIQSALHRALPLPADVLANYMAGAELALITWWVENDRPYSVDQMAEMAQRLILDGVQGVLGERRERNAREIANPA